MVASNESGGDAANAKAEPPASGLLSTLGRNLRALRLLGTIGSAIRKLSPERPGTYNDFLKPHFESFPDRPAIIGESSHLTWGELDRYANRVAHWAIGKGLRRGDVVAFSMENRPEFVAIWLGLSRVGVVAALMNTNLTGDRLAHCVREASPSQWIVGSELRADAESAISHLDETPRLYLSNCEARSETATTDGGSETSAHEWIDFEEELAKEPATDVDSEFTMDARFGDGLFLIYTSGTTGLPKAAKVSHSKAMTTGFGAKAAQRLTPNDRVYCCLPLYHSAGGMMAVGAALFSGGALVVARKFSATRFWSDCAQHDVTSIQYIGELCRYLVNSPEHPDERRHKVRVAIGNGLRPEVWTPFKDRFGIDRIVEFYGATEGNMALLNTEGEVGAVGHLPHFVRKAMGVVILRFDIDSESVVRDSEGHCIQADFGEPGEAAVKLTATARFEGYTNREASDKKILHDVFEKGDSYFRTGDLLRLDKNGFFYFVDRIGDTFRWKGENVATSEIAEVVSVHPGVTEANVYGVPVEGTDGRAGMAALVATREFDLDGFSRRVERELAAYARPLFLRMLPEMEITGTFKHRKVDLVREGFSPSTITDPLYFFDAAKGQYRPLDAGTYEAIQSGEIRV